MTATLSAGLWLEFRDLGLGKWDITLYHAKQGRLNESGPFDSFGDAVDGAKDALRSKADERAVDDPRRARPQPTRPRSPPRPRSSRARGSRT